jgi:hypothetical protein
MPRRPSIDPNALRAAIAGGEKAPAIAVRFKVDISNVYRAIKKLESDVLPRPPVGSRPAASSRSASPSTPRGAGRNEGDRGAVGVGVEASAGTTRTSRTAPARDGASPKEKRPPKKALISDKDERSLWDTRKALDENYQGLDALLDPRRSPPVDAATALRIRAEKRATILAAARVMETIYSVQAFQRVEMLLIEVFDRLDPHSRDLAFAEIRRVCTARRSAVAA